MIPFLNQLPLLHNHKEFLHFPVCLFELLLCDLLGKKKVSGRCAVIGGGLVGTETAEYLLEQGCTVSIVEMLDKVAIGVGSIFS